jgi:hypothetical protein
MILETIKIVLVSKQWLKQEILTTLSNNGLVPSSRLLVNSPPERSIILSRCTSCTYHLWLGWTRPQPWQTMQFPSCTEKASREMPTLHQIWWSSALHAGVYSHALHWLHCTQLSKPPSCSRPPISWILFPRRRYAILYPTSLSCQLNGLF